MSDLRGGMEGGRGRGRREGGAMMWHGPRSQVSRRGLLTQLAACSLLSSGEAGLQPERPAHPGHRLRVQHLRHPRGTMPHHPHHTCHVPKCGPWEEIRRLGPGWPLRASSTPPPPSWCVMTVPEKSVSSGHKPLAHLLPPAWLLLRPWPGGGPPVDAINQPDKYRMLTACSRASAHAGGAINRPDQYRMLTACW